jgi:hypothetical protein
LQLAHKKNRLGRSLRVSIPDSIYQMLWQRLGSPPDSEANEAKSFFVTNIPKSVQSYDPSE